MDDPTDTVDVEFDLERADLARLLDRALALLPSATRTMLIEHCINEMPHAEIAARLGMSEGAVKVGVHRGKVALRRVLATDFSQDIAAYGLSLSTATTWRETRIWCPFCGVHRLVASLDHAAGHVAFCCPGRCSALDGTILHCDDSPVLEGVRSPKAILSRHLLWLDRYYRDGLARGAVACASCRAPAALRAALPDEAPPQVQALRGLHSWCPRCGIAGIATLWHLVLDLPQTQQFWRAHPRMRALPLHEIEVEGSPALVTRFESLTGRAHLDIISARDTYAIMGLHGAYHG